jgi:putative ABC transport system permease protein
MRGRLAAVVAICAAAFAVFVGGFSALDSLTQAQDRWFKQGNLADLELHHTPVAAIPPSEPTPVDFTQIPGVIGQRDRITTSGEVELPDSKTLALQLISAPEADAQLNTLLLLDGSTLVTDDTGGVLIDYHLRDHHDIHVGDPLTLKVAGNTVTLTVRGIVQDAQFLVEPANPVLFVPSQGTLGVCFVLPEVIEELQGFAEPNSILLRLSADANHDEVRSAILDLGAESGLNQPRVETQHEQFSARFLLDAIVTMRALIPAIVGVCALAAVFVLFFMLAQLLNAQRANLGVLLTLGYRTRALAGAFAALLATLAAISTLLGVAAAHLVSWAFAHSLAVSVGVPDPEIVVDWSLAVLGTGVVFAVFALGGGYLFGTLGTLTPLDAMRTPDAGQPSPGALSGWLGRTMPASWLRMALRNAVRSGWATWLTVFSMALGFGVAAGFLMAFSSVQETVVANVRDQAWTLQVDFRTPQTQQQLDELLARVGSPEAAGYLKGSVVLHRQNSNGALREDSRTENLYITGYDPATAWDTGTLTTGRFLNHEDSGGLLLDSSTLGDNSLVPGSAVSLESADGRFEAHVVGGFAAMMPNEAKVTQATARELLGIPEGFTGAFIRTTDGEIAQIRDDLTDMAEVISVMSKDEATTQLLTLIAQLTNVVKVGGFIGVAVSLLFVLACLGHTVQKRQGDYQLLRQIGFRDRTATATILTETLLIGILATLVAVPAGYAVAALTCSQVSKVWFEVAAQPNIADYALVLVPSLCLLPLIAAPMARSVLSQPLDVFIRSRNVG